MCYNNLIMKHIFEQKVYYADTDSYGVVWHGSYLRWMEMGRVDLCEELGINLQELKAQDIVIPVVGLNIRYKSSARVDDVLIIETYVKKIGGFTVTFEQIIKNKLTGAIYTQAEVEIVAINNSGKLYRKLPENLVKLLEGALCNV